MSVQLNAVIIEDDLDIRGLVTAIVSRRGIKVHQAPTGEEGLAAVREYSPAMVILDYGLPDINGLEVLARIKQFSDTRILMLTAREDLAETILAAGADAFLAKPFNPRDLHTRIESLLATSVPSTGPPSSAENDTGS